MESKKVLEIAVKACDDKQAQDVMILNMKEISIIADYFLICHANNERQVQAIARAIKDKLEEYEIAINHIEGFEQSRWIIVDTGHIICHIFHEEERKYYNLERLWGDASEVSLPIHQEK